MKFKMLLRQLNSCCVLEVQKIPVRMFAAVEIAAPVMAHCTTCSWEVPSHVRASATPVIAPATALFFCNKTVLFRNTEYCNKVNPTETVFFFFSERKREKIDVDLTQS